jgi:UDP-N-acetylglucosamine diphosphorylase / glucose-1-phosphate thymidylyltransferase / UDP-N-acetylgalactosamine diphosphorylase / glucosamine-1-phosphate N-acetyltransferase / galactosamine-1-phosphate N-acetyltransferase
MVSRGTFGSAHFFDLSKLWFAELFEGVDYPWELLTAGKKEGWIEQKLQPNLKALKREGSLVVETLQVGGATVEAGSYVVGDRIELRSGAVIEAGAWVTGPTILGPGTAIRHGAYVRGGVITGEKAVIGHASEAKSSIFLNGAKAPHFAYVGDSILGSGVNLGAGTKVSNLKITNTEIKLRIENEVVPTGLRKMGAIIGDHVETGCNSVLNPGVLLAPKCMVYPAIAVRAQYYKPGSVIR